MNLILLCFNNNYWVCSCFNTIRALVIMAWKIISFVSNERSSHLFAISNSDNNYLMGIPQIHNVNNRWFFLKLYNINYSVMGSLFIKITDHKLSYYTRNKPFENDSKQNYYDTMNTSKWTLACSNIINFNI